MTEERFDLLVAGGELLDPGAGRSGRLDVAISGGVVRRIAPAIERGAAAEVLDAEGCIVVPGLVDLHTHVFAGAGYWGLDPRPVAWRTGVTTWVDAGSAGAFSFGALRRLAAELAPLRVRAFLNVSAVGLVAETGEGREEGLCDPGLCAATVGANRDLLVGVKCRLDHAAAAGRGIGLLRLALEAAAAAGVPVMAHVGTAPPPIEEVLDLLRPGDVLTHCTTGQTMAIVGRDGRVLDAARRARERGVLFDVGHGSGAFSFAVAEALAEEGFWPDVVSSDLHQRSVLGPAFDLPTCIAKLLAVGMPLEAAVAATTSAPAAAIGLGGEAGAIEVGRRADLAVFALERGEFSLFDTYLQARTAPLLLANRATLAGGRQLAPSGPEPPAPWIAASAEQLALVGARGEDRRPWAADLRRRESFLSWLRQPEPPRRRRRPDRSA